MRGKFRESAEMLFPHFNYFHDEVIQLFLFILSFEGKDFLLVGNVHAWNLAELILFEGPVIKF